MSLKRRHTGLTLIETVAAMALMGLLLVAVLTARADHVHQWSRSELKARAVQAADRLLAEWWASEEDLPTDAEGEIEGLPGVRWRTSVRQDAALAELGVEVLTVELTVSGAAEDRSLVSLELLMATDDDEEPGSGRQDADESGDINNLTEALPGTLR